MSAKTNVIKPHPVERVLALLGAAWCLTVTTVVSLLVSQQQAIWPVPGLYFIEVVALALAAAWAIFRADPAGNLLAWAMIGALAGFAFMGVFSVGSFYWPVAGLFGLAMVWLDRQDWRRLPLHLGVALLAAVAQAALMLAIIQALYPNT